MRIFNSPAFSRVALIGWVLIISGGGWDLVYHLAPLVSNVRWTRAIDTLGEFGHTVILVGMVIVVFAVLLYHSRHKSPGNDRSSFPESVLPQRVL